MIVDGYIDLDVPDPVGLLVDPRWFARPMMRSSATKFVLHETTGTRNPFEYLRGKRLSVQFVIEADGVVRQHADAASFCEHVGSHNGVSVGVEVVSPYYPDRRPKSGPWDTVIEAPWAHKGLYVVPTAPQAEAAAQLTQMVCAHPHWRLEVPLVHRGLRGRRFMLSELSPDGRPAGVYAHQHLGGHADGAWLALYTWMRLAVGMQPEDAYAEAIARVTGARGSIDVGDLLAGA